MDDPEPAADSGPFFQFPTDEQSLVLYEGPLEARRPGESPLVGEGQILFDWRPSPGTRVRFRAQLDSAVSLADGRGLEFTTPSQVARPNTAAKPWPRLSSTRTVRIGAGAGSVVEVDEARRLDPIGNIDGAAVVQMTVVNLDRLTFVGPVDLRAGGWEIRVEEHPDTHRESLRTLGGHGPTHLLTLCCDSGQPITREALDDLTERLWLFLAFVNGALPGFALTVALSATREPLWVSWPCTTVDPWRGRLRWYDETQSAQLANLFSSWWRRTNDDFWLRVLKRAVRIVEDANDPRPLDTAVIAGWAVLELLAWAVLEVEQAWVGADSGSLTAAGQVRLLLAWAGVPASIPPHLTALVGVANADANLTDGPSVLAWIRNRLVHPPKRPSHEWPGSDPLHEAWRLEMQYAELILLRLLDYHGKYSSRIRLDGSHTGDVDVVPWADAERTDLR